MTNNFVMKAEAVDKICIGRFKKVFLNKMVNIALGLLFLDEKSIFAILLKQIKKSAQFVGVCNKYNNDLNKIKIILFQNKRIKGQNILDLNETIQQVNMFDIKIIKNTNFEILN